MSELKIQRFHLPLHQWAVLVAAFLVFIVVANGKVRYTEGDSRYELLVSQSILQHGNIRLDAYQNEIDLSKLNNDHGWMVHRWDDTGHYYYFYPIGNSILSVPFVWIARRFGMDMLYLDHESWLQILIAAFVLSLIFLQLYRLARLWLEPWTALPFSLLLVLGTSVASTGGAALWSHDFEALAIVSVLLELLRHAKGQLPKLRVGYIGTFLFAAYLCRPTALVVVVLVMGYVAWQFRPDLPKLLAWFFGPMALFVAFSFFEFGRPVPVYYDPSTWPGNEDFFGNLLAILLSPGRGLWIFMPFALLPFLGWLQPSLRLKPLWLMLWAWWLLHTIMVARSGMPWGGWCYGPRFYMEMVPGFALMILMMLDHWEELHARIRTAFMPVFLVLMLAGTYVHTVQGLYEPATSAWNDFPSIDERWKDERWDWRYPQFLANAQSNGRRHREMDMLLPVGQFAARAPRGSAILYGSPDLEMRNIFAHWNRINKLKDWRVYNSLAAVDNSDEKSFWFTADKLPQMQQMKGWGVDSSDHRLSLAEFLSKEEANTVILSVQDEGSFKLSKESRAYLRKLGSRIDSLKFRDSYAAVIDKGKLVWEDMGAKRVSYEWPGNPYVRVGSAGLTSGNGSSIIIGDKEVSLHARGFNVAVLGSTRTLIWSTCFDTHKEDAERRFMYKGVRKAGN